jgi:glutamyl-tRNA(Gln) amidotransferase subunit D
MKKNEQSEGYRDEALKLLKKADVEIGDKIRLTREDEVFEGILIPVSEYSDGKHVVIKLKSGYNIGLRITENAKIEKTGEGTKPTFTTSELPKQDKTLPKVAIISTGGTIASRVDYRTGAVRSALTASDLYSVVPELVNIAQIDAHVLFSIMSENMTPKHWEKIAETAAQKIVEGADGVVIAHGTDTMGYTAAALSFALQNLPVPVILVGSQRSADRPSSDSATNLIGAVTAAAKAPLAEVAVAFHETLSDTTIALHRGTKVRKCHTSRRDTFKSVNALPLATVQGQKVAMLTTDYRKRNPANRLELKPSFDDKVALIKFHPGIDSSLIDWHVEKRYKGIVLEGTGLGHVGKRLYDALKNAVKNDVVVGMASQCVWGRIDMNVYDSGRDLLSLGVIPLEDMLAETALVKLMWIFGQTQSVDETKRLLTTNIAGEFSPRTLPESEPC